MTKSDKKINGAGLYLGDSLKLLPNVSDLTIDLTITSPPYFVGKEYDESKNLKDFIELHKKIIPEVVRATKEGGSICWQVGYHIDANFGLTPLDFDVHKIMMEQENLKLRNRIIWKFGHGLHTSKRFSGRHEVILWYTKGDNYHFDLDAVRVAQKYPGKTYHKGNKRGELSGNPLGKNPEDVWDIPNVKSNHIEKTAHPCQFPISLASRLIRALCPKNGLVMDPFLGSGTTAAAAIIENRAFLGIEKEKLYFDIAKARCDAAAENTLNYRLDEPVMTPDPKSKVATKPAHFTGELETRLN